MAYNNGFPVNYQQPYYYPQSQQSNGLIWVQGEAGARSFLVGPNTTVALWDSENQVVYIKSADASGMPSIKVLDYTVRSDNTQPSKESNYATTADISEIYKKLEAIEKRLYSRKEKHYEPTVRADE